MESGRKKEIAEATNSGNISGNVTTIVTKRKINLKQRNRVLPSLVHW